MFPYYLLFLVIYFSAYYDLCRGDSFLIKKSFHYLFLFITFSIFIILTGLKGNVGTDYNGYLNLYTIWGTKKYTEPFVSVMVEPGFWFLTYIFNFCNFPFPVFWFFIVLLSLTTKFLFFRKFSPYLFLSLLIYLSGLFIERDFDGIRQGLSVGFAYIAIMHYLDRRIIKYLFFLLFAVSMHYSSLVFLLIPILYRVRLKNWLVYSAVGTGLVFLVLRIDVLSLILRFLPIGYITSRINTYSAQGNFTSSIGLNLGIIIRILVLFLFCHIDYKKALIQKNVYYFLRNGFLFSILCFLFFNNMEIIAHRLAYGFREFQIVIIPICFKYYVIDRKYGKNTKIMGFQIYCLYAFILFYRMINAPHLREYYEYHLIF